MSSHNIIIFSHSKSDRPGIRNVRTCLVNHIPFRTLLFDTICTMINHGTCLGLTAVVGHLVYIMRCGYISVQRIFSIVTTFIFSREIDHEKIQIYIQIYHWIFQCFNTLELKRRTLTILHSLCSKIRSQWINSLYVKYLCNPVCAGSGQFKPIYTFDSNNFWFCLYNVRHWDPSTSQKFQIFNWKSQLFGNFGYFPPSFHLIFISKIKD